MQRDLQECMQQDFQGQQRYQAQNYQNIIPETSDAVVYSNYMNKNVVGAIKPVKKYSNESLLTPKGKSQTLIYQSKQSNSSRASTSTITEESSAENVVMPLKEVTSKPIETIIAKNEAQNQRKIRSDKLQALYKSGPRAFSGPVEKVLKWHKLLKEIGVLVLYEIVAKCLRIRQGKPYEKILVIKDEIGPAMEVVYYEIDFLLPEFTIPCTVRVVGRMLSGSCRLQAYSVRAATGDDIASLPRRAAVAQHHVAKLAKEYTQ
ncbi:PREDICTED: uncharacterized protein LOC106107528 [Papilio polytes]|uniref:uncharacterized protein LOC106107528 n=1 Tax=Papilio polytes TaxID=76194 RepID=UPI0006767D75|nr:PREDICTED: uncharacterized protein LOC106107528 [Papilio polytes]